MTGTDSHTYAVECFEPGVARASVAVAARRAREAAAALRAEGREVEHVDTLLMPDDEVVLHVFAADAPETARDASVRAGVAFERVIEVVSVPPDGGPLQK